MRVKRRGTRDEEEEVGRRRGVKVRGGCGREELEKTNKKKRRRRSKLGGEELPSERQRHEQEVAARGKSPSQSPAQQTKR